MQDFLTFFGGGWDEQFLVATVVTLLLSLGAYVVGLLIAIFFTISNFLSIRYINKVSSIYTVLFRGIPELLIILLLFYICSDINRHFGFYDIVIGSISAIMALGLICGSYLTEIFRASLNSIAIGQIQAAEALGLPKKYIILHILFPQLLKLSIMPVFNIWLIVIKDSAVISIIGIPELMFKTNLAVTSTSNPFIYYSITFFIYLMVTIVSNILFKQFIYKKYGFNTLKREAL